MLLWLVSRAAVVVVVGEEGEDFQVGEHICRHDLFFLVLFGRFEFLFLLLLYVVDIFLFFVSQI